MIFPTHCSYNFRIRNCVSKVSFVFQTYLSRDPFFFSRKSFLLIYKENHHIALAVQSAVNATWRVSTGVLAKARTPCGGILSSLGTFAAASHNLQQRSDIKGAFCTLSWQNIGSASRVQRRNAGSMRGWRLHGN